MPSESLRRLFEVCSGISLTPSIGSWDLLSSLGAGAGGFVLFEPSSVDEMKEVVSLAVSLGKGVSLLGNGFNIAGRDEDITDRIFLKPRKVGEFSYERVSERGVLTFGSRIPLREGIRFGLSYSFGGLSGLSGIPGSVGGAVAMNAGARGVTVSDFLVSVKVLTLEKLPRHLDIPASDCMFAYRSSRFLAGGEVILGASFQFSKCDPVLESDLIQEENERRGASPKGRSAGSVFRNPDGGPPAGKLLEEAGCKGMRCGAFLVSPLHANWIIRDSSVSPAFASDLFQLIGKMADAVKCKYHITLVPEIRKVK